MDKNIQGFKQLLSNIGCDERILKNPSFSDFPILRDAIVLFVNDKNINVNVNEKQIELKRFLENDSFVIFKNGHSFVISYRNNSNTGLNFYSEIMCDQNGNIRVIEHHDMQNKIVHDFTPSGLEIEIVRKTENNDLMIEGIRRQLNGYVGQIWSSKLNEDKTATTDTIIGYVDIDLRTPSLKFGSGYNVNNYDEVYRALSMNRVSYVSSEKAKEFADEVCGITWPVETKKELIERIGNKDINNIFTNEKFNEENYKYRRTLEEENASKTM